ncbi:MAG TPA: nucleotidyltransferase substrate binding protein [Methylomirabilota bacterium]|nr:nucleotidyltransferase substrate binding protein [Methylomirabilota bacterium]
MTEGSAARRIAILSQALAGLQEALSVPEDPIVRDACIQRFEFTFEMAWRASRHMPGSRGSRVCRRGTAFARPSGSASWRMIPRGWR